MPRAYRRETRQTDVPSRRAEAVENLMNDARPPRLPRPAAGAATCYSFAMMKRVVLASLSLAMAVPALAHHSFAMFDHTRTLTLNGEVTKFQWTNPHAILDLDAPGPGAVKHFTLELPSINMMQRIGWRSNFIRAGDHVKAIVAPLLNGQPGGLLLEVTLPDGKTLQTGVPAIGTFKRTPESE